MKTPILPPPLSTMLCCRHIPLAKTKLLGSSIVPQLPQRSFLQKALLQRLSQLNPHQQRYITTSPPKPPLAARIVSSLPPRGKPYAYLARLDKPVGSWLLYWPCAWSITLAAAHTQIPPAQLFSMLGLFGIGAVVMRGAGCTINDLWDRNLDKQVERTATRPLAAGDLTVLQAIGFLGVQMSVGLAVLTQLNWYSILLGASSLSLVVTYPLFKRITYWPQFVLGLAFNWGALLGWPALLGGEAMAWGIVLPLYVSGIFWTLAYDTIYAHQDKKDDVQVGIKSTALRFGSATKPILTAFTIAQLSLLGVVGVTLDAGVPFYAGVLAAGAVQGWMLWDVNIDDTKSCGKWFVRNVWTGGIIWLGCLAEWMVRIGALGLGEWFSITG